jgi:hypothetical protein
MELLARRLVLELRRPGLGGAQQIAIAEAEPPADFAGRTAHGLLIGRDRRLISTRADVEAIDLVSTHGSLIVEVVRINLLGLRRHDHAGRLSLLLLLLDLLLRALALDLDLGLEGSDALKEQVDSVLILEGLHILIRRSQNIGI